MAVIESRAGRGGAEIGGAATTAFVHGTGQADADVVLEWDFDNDGDFDEPVETITSDVVEIETQTGRDFPSQLTGKAGPGRLKATLRNDSDQYQVFNQNSPLEQEPFSLDAGRKVRLRTTDAADPDPELLARDRFRQADGPLVGRTTETGQTWESLSVYADFRVEDSIARAQSFRAHLNVVDVGASDYYAQIRLGRIPQGQLTPDTAVGIVYRFTDTDNFSYVTIRADAAGSALVEATDVVAGSPSTGVLSLVAVYDGRILSIDVQGDDVTFYLEGVEISTLTAPNASATRVGIWGDWHAHTPPEVASIHVWDRFTARTDGVLWTGDVEDIVATSPTSRDKTARLSGVGRLTRLATQEIEFPGLVGNATMSGAMGRVLSETGLLTPPGSISSSVETGRFALQPAKAIDVARRIEETELGFLHEAAEGWINFDARNERVGDSPVATFSDTPGTQFAWQRIRLLNWRREIFNQVKAASAPDRPELPSGVVHAATFPGVEFNLGSIKAGIEPGDLLLGWAICGGLADVDWHGHVGWEELTAGKPQSIAGNSGDNYRLFARRADGTEGDMPDFLAVATCTSDVEFLADLVIIRGWWGELQQGVKLGAEAFGATPPPLEIPWYPNPTKLFVLRVGLLGTDAEVEGWSEQGFDGYQFGQEHTRFAVNGGHLAMQRAHRDTAALELEEPAAFDGTFSGFDYTISRAFAVEGAPGVEVQVEDLASQDRHNAIKSHQNASNLFTSADDARAYGDAVLARHATRRPVIEMMFSANKSRSYRQQAARRRVGDMIHLVATGNSGLGVEGDFHIENIVHRISSGGKAWNVTWQLSPA